MKTQSQIHPFSLSEVTLTEGLFQQLTQVNADVIRSISADTILYAFRYNANTNYGATFPLPGEAFGGWSAPGHVYAGHFEGHFMSAAAMLYTQTKEESLREKLIAIVDGLEEVQNLLYSGSEYQKPGYLSGFSEERFNVLESGSKCKVPWYMIHKIMQGLLDIYKYTGYEKALCIVTKMADWADWRTGRFSYEEMQKILTTDEYGGMQDVLVDLSDVTGNSKYYELSNRFVQRESLLDCLYEDGDNLTGLHGNTYLAKIVGCVTAYHHTGEEYYKTVTKNFWDRVIDGRTYVTGGNSQTERFTEPHKISKSLTGNTCETCNVYNMLKLTRALFCWTGSEKYADYYETALFNQILGSMDTANGDKTYYQFMAPGSVKKFNSNRDGNFCCNGTGLESFVKLQDSIYFHSDDAVFVNLFVNSKLRWEEKQFALEQSVSFPEETCLKIEASENEEIALKIRVPRWSLGGITLTINGANSIKQEEKDGYVILKGKWTKGDTITVRTNPQFSVVPTSDDPNVLSITYGPLVLAGVDTQEDGILPMKKEEILQNLTWDSDSSTATLQTEKGEKILLLPYYIIQHQPHTIYWTLGI